VTKSQGAAENPVKKGLDLALVEAETPQTQRCPSISPCKFAKHWGPNSLLPSLLSCGFSFSDLTVGCCINSLQYFNHPTYLLALPLQPLSVGFDTLD